MLSNCGDGEDSWESLGLQGVKISRFERNQPWIFIGSTDTETPILWPPDSKSWLIEKDPDGGEDKRRRGQQRMRCLDSITNPMDMNLSKLQEIVKDREAWRAAIHGVTKSWTWLSDWATTTSCTQMFVKMVISFRSFTDKQKLREFSTTKPALQQMLKDLL